MKGLLGFTRWLYPGLGVKRWLLLLGFGVVLISFGVSHLFTQTFPSASAPNSIWNLMLESIPVPVRSAALLASGFALAGIAIYRLSRSILSPFIPQSSTDLWDALYARNYLKHGPRIVAIGGGTGLSTLLRGLKEYTSNITAIVTVADDGGSSGRLRRELGMPPPGDFRQCIAALADVEPLMAQLLQYRFGEGSGLEGHSFGNLFIAAMTSITGNFEQALLESSRVLAVRGHVLPSTLANVTLCAEFEDNKIVRGEHLISERRQPIKQLFLEPSEVAGYKGAMRAIEKADLIIVGPGSLYTSVMPNLLVKGIAQSLRKSKAVKVYVCNVAAQAGETEGFSVGDHVQALVDQLGEDVFDYVLANNNFRPVNLHPSELKAVPLRGQPHPNHRHRVVLSDLVDTKNSRLHDSKKLAESVIRLVYGNEARRAA